MFGLVFTLTLIVGFFTLVKDFKKWKERKYEVKFDEYGLYTISNKAINNLKSNVIGIFLFGCLAILARVNYISARHELHEKQRVDAEVQGKDSTDKAIRDSLLKLTIYMVNLQGTLLAEQKGLDSGQRMSNSALEDQRYPLFPMSGTVNVVVEISRDDLIKAVPRMANLFRVTGATKINTSIDASYVEDPELKSILFGTEVVFAFERNLGQYFQMNDPSPEVFSVVTQNVPLGTSVQISPDQKTISLIVPHHFNDFTAKNNLTINGSRKLKGWFVRCEFPNPSKYKCKLSDVQLSTLAIGYLTRYRLKTIRSPKDGLKNTLVTITLKVEYAY